jgi:hypothetical protein
VPGPAKHSETGGPEEAHLAQHGLRAAGQGDPSNPTEALSRPRVVAAPIPRLYPDARTRAGPGRTGRSTGCPQKQSLPYIRKVQYTVLSVAGLKGTMAQAELHFLHARLQGGKLNKAKKGEWRFPLPVGFCYDQESRIIFDPDEEVRGAVGLVFRLFRETGQRLWGDATIRGKRITLSQAVLWWGLGWQDYMGSPDA